MFLPLYLIVVGTASHCSALSQYDTAPNIAIIGGGVGGASCAYHLRQLFGPQLKVTVYEAGKVGGRARVVSFSGMDYEAGGSAIHSRNREMLSFLETLGLKKNEDSGSSTFAFYDGHELTFESSRYSLLTSLRMLWRYGSQLVKLQQLTASYLNDFERIYSWQQELQAFTTLPNLLLSMSDAMLNSTQHQLRRSLLDLGLGKQIIDELVAAAMKVNYGQTPDNLHAFVGFVGLVGMDNDLWSVKGGNYLIAKGLLELAASSVVTEEVLAVELVPPAHGSDAKSRYRLLSVGGNRLYDAVVLAAPFVEGLEENLIFTGFTQDVAKKILRPYKHIVSTFVKGKPNYKTFGFSSPDDFPDSIFVTGNSFFNSMRLQAPVNESSFTDGVYKVFSPAELTSVQISELFESHELVKAVPWYAYPLYSPEASFPPVVLHENLYYANSIEIVASAMEMSAVAGRNAAQLVYNRWMDLEHLVDNMFVIEEKHIKMEL